MVAKVIFSSKKLSLRKINFIAPAMLNVTSYLGICNEAKLVSYLITTKKWSEHGSAIHGRVVAQLFKAPAAARLLIGGMTE